MNNITMFKSEIIDNIYSFLVDIPTARQALGCSCHRFRNIFCENEKYLAIAKFVSKKYIVCATNLNHFSLWRQLKMAKAILTGESHNVPKHRKIFADLTHLIWTKNMWALLTEGGVRMELGTGQIKYLQNQIAETHETWDIKCPAFFEQSRRLVVNILKLTREFLNVRDEKNSYTGIMMMEELLSNFRNLSLPIDTTIIESLERMKILLERNQKYEEDELSFLRNVIFYRNEKAFVLFQIGQLTYELINQYAKELENLMEKFLLRRDQEMIVNVDQQIASGKNALVIAGTYHVIERENSPPNLLQKKGVPYLALIPKERTHKVKTEAPLQRSPREQLKSCDLPFSKNISWCELHHYFALNPGEVILAELQNCIEEAKQLNSLALSISHS